MVKYFLFIFLFFTSFVQAEIKNFDLVYDGIYRGGDLNKEADYKMLRDYKIDLVINFRVVKDDEKLCKEYGLDCRHYPIFMLLPFSDMFFPYEKLQKAYREVIRAVEDGKNVFIHCYAGKDRTGAIASALKLRELACWQEYDIKEMKALITMNLENYGFAFYLYPFLYRNIMKWVEELPAWICEDVWLQYYQG